MTLKTGRFVSKSYPVEAVEVSSKNIDAVASWCRGMVCVTPTSNPAHQGKQYVKVHVHLPRNVRQTQAYIGDVVLYAGKGFKVYSNQAFKDNFMPVGEAQKLVRLEAGQDVQVIDLIPDKSEAGVQLLKAIFEQPKVIDTDNQEEIHAE